MGNNKGQFKKGAHASPETEFKKGQHWRPRKPYWDYDWLYNAYIVERKSAAQIGDEQGCRENNILYFLKKHGIPTRTMKEVRAFKHWGVVGSSNPMYGRTGPKSPNWKGGCTPERQALYGSEEWGQVALKVWQRDKGTCQKCEKHKESYLDLFHIHHVVSFSDSVELRTELANLVLLCAECHRWVHGRENEDQDFIEKGGDEGC